MKMNKLYLRSICFLALMLAISSCAVEGPTENAPVQEQLPQISPDVVSGELLVRFDARVSDILEKNGLTKSGVGSTMTRSGLLSVDEILDMVEGYQIERVFPVDRRTEDQAREAGLHLWYYKAGGTIRKWKR